VQIFPSGHSVVHSFAVCSMWDERGDFLMYTEDVSVSFLWLALVGYDHLSRRLRSSLSSATTISLVGYDHLSRRLRSSRWRIEGDFVLPLCGICPETKLTSLSPPTHRVLNSSNGYRISTTTRPSPVGLSPAAGHIRMSYSIRRRVWWWLRVR